MAYRDDHRIIGEYQAGEDLVVLAKKYHVTISHIVELLHREGIPLRPDPLSRIPGNTGAFVSKV